jgi:hypothetical protein
MCKSVALHTLKFPIHCHGHSVKGPGRVAMVMETLLSSWDKQFPPSASYAMLVSISSSPRILYAGCREPGTVGFSKKTPPKVYVFKSL